MAIYLTNKKIVKQNGRLLNPGYTYAWLVYLCSFVALICLLSEPSILVHRHILMEVIAAFTSLAHNTLLKQMIQ